MTTKTEQSASGAESSVAVEPAGAAEPSPLPSIIVDAKALVASEGVADAGGESPSSEASAVSGSAPANHDAATPSPGAAEAVPSLQPAVAARADAAEPEAVDTAAAGAAADAAAGAAADAEPARDDSSGNGADHGDAIQLSDFDAERFATTFRASWEPGQALDAPMPEAPPPSARPSSGAPGAIASAAAAEPLVLPGSARSRGLMLTAVAVAAFVALLALALSSTNEPPPTANAERAREAHEPQRAIENTPAEVPAAVPAVQPTAVAPVEPTAPVTAQAAGAPAAAGTAAAAPSDPAAAAPAPEAPIAAIPAAAPTPVLEVAPEPTPEPAPPPRIETVRIRLATSPKDATLSIDGITVPNPYDQLLPKGGSHRIGASAPDHESREQLVDFERKRDLVLRLTRVPAPRPTPAPVAKAPRAPRPTAARAPRKAATSGEPPAKGAAFVSESPY